MCQAIVSRSKLLAVASAIGAVGFFPVVPAAHGEAVQRQPFQREDGDAPVPCIGHEQPPVGADLDTRRLVELALAGARND